MVGGRTRLLTEHASVSYDANEPHDPAQHDYGDDDYQGQSYHFHHL